MYFFIFAVIAALDQIIKYIVVSSIDYNYEIEVVKNFFYLTNIRNRGAAWGILQNYRIFFIVITTVIVFVMLHFMVKEKSNYIRVMYAFIIGGAIGNFVDRLFRGYVIDFLDFYIGPYHFPTFNVADIFITLGSILLVYEVVCKEKESYA